MYTGYFAKIKSYIKDGLIPISISVKPPYWFMGYQYKKLAPPSFLLYDWKEGLHKGDVDYYTKVFEESILNKVSIESVISDLKNLTLTDLDSIILLCYEKPSSFCHRHLISQWFNKNGIECKEKLNW